MRIFGKVLQTIRLSRRSSSCYKSRRYSSLVCQNSLHTRLNSYRTVRNVGVRSLGSKSGSNPSIDKNNDSKILPVALIKSKSTSTCPTKIMLIPINLFEGDDEAAKKTLNTLSIIRQHARQIEAFTDNLMEPSYSKSLVSPPIAASSSSKIINELESHNEVPLWSSSKGTEQNNEPQEALGLYDGLEKAIAEQEMNRIEAHDAFDVAAWNSSTRQLFAYVPESLEEKLKQMAISSMQLAFEMDMTNIRDAIVMSSATKNINMFKPPTPKSLQDPTLTITTSLEIDGPEHNKTIPLSFNALIQGTVEIDPSKFTPDHLGQIKVPEFNDYVTAIAANICSTALQKGFPADISRMSYSTKSTANPASSSKGRNPHIVCVREGDKGCVSPGNADLPPFVPAGASGSGSGKKAKKSKAEISLLSSSAIIGDYSPRGLMSCKAYARALVEAAKRREAIAKAKRCQEILKPKSIKSRLCASIEARKKKDKCGSTKNNPCGKDPNPDPCKEFNPPKVEPPKKQQPEKKKGDPCNEDPCKSAKKKKDPCRKKDDCHRGHPCTRKERNPCGTGKVQKIERKKPVCPNQPPDRCNQKDDACARKEQMEEEERCRKEVEKTCHLDDPCSHHPCEKVQDDYCKNNKKKCSGTSEAQPSKCAAAAKPESKCESSQKTQSQSKCTPKNTGSKCDVSTKPEAKCIPQNTGSKCDPPKSQAAQSKCGTEDPCGKTKAECSGAAKPCKAATTKSSCGINPCAEAKKSGSKCGSLKKSVSNSKCESAKKSSSDSKCTPSKKESKCGAKKSASDSKCTPSKKESKCAPKKSASESKCTPSKKESKCAPKKSASDSKCGASKKESKCAPKKSASDSKCGASKKESKCAPKKSASDSKCGASKKESKCAPKKSASDSKCGPSKKESKCGLKKSASGSKCTPSKESKCGTSKPAEVKCGPPKKKCPNPKCGSTEKSESKCGSQNKSESKCGSLKKSGSKCTPSKKESKCGPKKSASGSKCTPSKESKCASKKSASGSKCTPSKESKCAPKKSASGSKCTPSKKESKCGAKKSASDSIFLGCEAEKKQSKCPKKSASDSKCASSKKESKCGAKKSASGSKCTPSKKESKCGTSKPAEFKCGPPKKKCPNPKCGSTEKSESKCGSLKKSDSKCTPSKKESKCGPKKSASGSKCTPSKESKCAPKKSASGSKCTPSKESKCAPKKSASGSKCTPSKESKCAPKKSASGSKCTPSKESKCAPKKSASGSKCTPSKESKCGPKKSASDSKCTPSKKESKCGPKKSASGSKCTPSKESKCGTSKPAEVKCGPPKKKCPNPKCGSTEKSESKCGGQKRPESKCGPPKKSESKSESKCGASKKSTKPNCKGTDSKGSSSPCSKKFSTTTFTKELQEIFPIKRSFSTMSMLSVKMSTSSVREFSSKKDGKKIECGECLKLVLKKPRVRKDIKARTKPYEVCWDDRANCPRVYCKDPKVTACSKSKKENKSSSMLNFGMGTQATNPPANFQMRTFSTNAVNRIHVQDENDDDEECNVYENENEKGLKKYTNEVIKITEPCKVVRVSESVPNFSDYDVLIRTEAVALGGSDLHFYETGGRSFPGMTLGHDASGIVEMVGKCITTLRPGDRVAIESGLSCGICDYCKAGCYNICNQLIYNGFLSKYQVHPADLCHKLPKGISMEDGCLTQTLALGCQACCKAQVRTTSRVLVIGSSPTAVSSALCARALGVKEVCVACSMQEPLEEIERNFDFECVLYEPAMQYTEILECIFSSLHDWPDVVINCAVSERTMNVSVMALKPCGVCVMAECDSECVCFNAMDVLMKNIKLLPSFRSINMFPTALELIHSGKAPIGQLVSKVFTWNQIEIAFRSALHESNIGNRKVIVKCAEEENTKESTKT